MDALARKLYASKCTASVFLLVKNVERIAVVQVVKIFSNFKLIFKSLKHR
jgi:hypothetical protein